MPSPGREAGRFLLSMLQYGCVIQVFHDHVAELKLVRRAARTRRRAGWPLTRRPAQCVGPSMLPAFNSSGNDVVLCEHLSTHWGA